MTRAARPAHDRLVLLLGLALCWGAACGDPPETPPEPDAAVPLPEADCFNGVDDDGDQAVDCRDYDCAAPCSADRCSAQQECGNIVDEFVTKVCRESLCLPPGSTTSTGDPVLVEAQFDLVFDAAFTQLTARPQSAVVRLVVAKKVDGTPLSCAELKTLNGSDEATRSQLDQNRTINQAFRTVYSLQWQGASTGEYVFSPAPAFVPRAPALLLYGEAWYGPRQLNNPTGRRASVACVEGLDLETAVPKTRYRVTFRP